MEQLTMDKLLESQERQILAYLKSGKTLTPIQALEMFGCFRLGARIFDLKDKGHDIKTTMIKTYSGKRIARYSYEQADS